MNLKRKYDLSEPGFRVGNIDIQNVKRPKGYSHSYRGGRIKHGFVYTVSGRMHNEFYGTDISEAYVSEGELMFIPAGTRYVGNYMDENTEIKIVQFDIVSGELPEYLEISESGPDHMKKFEVEVRLNNNVIGRGRGKTKKEAEQNAAEEACRLFELQV